MNKTNKTHPHLLVSDNNLEYNLTNRQLESIGNVCGKCRGLCCSSFMMNFYCVKHDDGTYEIDWEKEEGLAKGRDVGYKYDLRFVRLNFVILDISEGWSREGRMKVKFNCNCLNLRTSRCRAYNKRPSFCRRYVCISALEKGKVPDGVVDLMESQKEDGRNFGWKSGKTCSDKLWKGTLCRAMQRKIGKVFKEVPIGPSAGVLIDMKKKEEKVLTE